MRQQLFISLNFFSIFAGLFFSVTAYAYPLSGYFETGIRRLDYTNMVQQDERYRHKLPGGALLKHYEVMPGWGEEYYPGFPKAHTALSKQLTALIPPKQRDKYSIGIIDITDPYKPKLIGHNVNRTTNVGSVGKLLIAVAVLNELARIWPDNTAARFVAMRNADITADKYVLGDAHKVTLWDPEEEKHQRRELQPGDKGNLFEFLDWMMSASSNGAASMVGQQLILLREFGADYDPSSFEQQEFIKRVGARRLGQLFRAAMNDAIAAIGHEPKHLYQGSLFTRAAKNRVSGVTSRANTKALLDIMLKMEYGELIDYFSSDLLKKLMYLTQRRIRYASNSILNASAVYFKSGSLYSCFDKTVKCPKYQGDRINRLASVASIESPANLPSLRYIVVVVSDVLRVNSAGSHHALAKKVHRLVRKAQSQYNVEK